MPRRRQAGDAAAAPPEGFAIDEQPIEFDWLGGGADVAGAVDRMRIAQFGAPFAEVARRFEQRLFVLGRRKLRARAIDAANPLALLAVMVGENDPFDVANADVTEMIENSAVPQIEQDRRRAVAEHEHIACVGINEEIGPGLRRRPQRQPREVRRRFVGSLRTVDREAAQQEGSAGAAKIFHARPQQTGNFWGTFWGNF